MSDDQKGPVLRVPLGADADGRLWRPEDAAAGARLFCPGCRSPLTLRGGPETKVRRHFAHRADAPCSQETIQHQAAKALVAQVTGDFLAGHGPAVQVHRTCTYKHCAAPWARSFTPKADRVVIEHRLSSGRVADVAVLNGETVVAIVEIHVTNAVDDEKAKAIAGVPCAELEADQVLADPLNWHPKPERARPLPCPTCVDLERALKAAGVPRWADEMRPDKAQDQDMRREVALRGQRLNFVKRYDPAPGHGWVVFDVPVVELARAVPYSEWKRLDQKRRRHIHERAQAHPTLPAHVRYFWEAEAAIIEFGGTWLNPFAEATEKAGPNATLEELLGFLTGVGAALPTPAPSSAAGDRWTRIRRISKETGQPVPPKGSPYWIEPYRCFSTGCGAEMLVYSWEGHTWMTDEPPPEPRPGTLQHRFSKTAGGKYWANICPKCGMIQGENFIYKPEGPLPWRLRGE